MSEKQQTAESIAKTMLDAYESILKNESSINQLRDIAEGLVKSELKSYAPYQISGIEIEEVIKKMWAQLHPADDPYKTRTG